MKKNLLDKSLKQFRSKIWFYIIALFIISRLLYTIVGVTSIGVFNNTRPTAIPSHSFQQTVSPHPEIQMWYVWDSAHYAALAQNYNYLSFSKIAPTAHNNGASGYYQLSWFPLYPVTIKLVHSITRLSIAYSQLLISNVAFLLALFVLYKLVRIDEDDAFAKKVLVFMMVLPVSFIFSAALSESLFLLLVLSSFYGARSKRWWMAGLFGFLAALTRSVGFLLILPLAVEAIQQLGWPNFKTWKNFVKPALACTATVAGLVAFMVYCWIRTGDLFAYNHSQLAGWDISFHDPLGYVLHHLHRTSVILILAQLALIVATWRKLRFSYILFAFIYAAMACSLGELSNSSSLRYAGVLFPVAIAAAYLSKKRGWSDVLLASFAIVNGMLFILWVNWWAGYII